VVAAASLSDALARRLLALTLAWLVLFFGRETWGHLLALLAIPADFHLHRLQAAFELAGVLLAAWGAARALLATAARSRTVVALMAMGIAAALAGIGVERAGYLQRSTRAGEASLEAHEQERSDLEDALATVRAILSEAPGRAAAGRRATWGDQFTAGDRPVYASLTLAHIDQVSFLYHAMSLTSDVMELRDENDPAHDRAFGVRALIAPASREPLPHWRVRGRYGRFAVYECSSEGYFGLVDVGARYTGDPATTYEPSAAWLRSGWLRDGVVMALGAAAAGLPAVARWQPLPPVPAALLTPRGQILSEAKDGERYRARVHADRPCHVMLKVTWYPDLVATVDGRAASVLRVTPGFAAVPVSAGVHDVEVRYAPGSLKPVLLVLGVLLCMAVGAMLSAPVGVVTEAAATSMLARQGERLWTAQLRNGLVLLGLVLLALHPLFRGQLIDGHDATAYPPRLVEFGRAVRDGHIPPLWAPDLGNGYGQPLFAFAPPLLYAVAYPFHAAGCRLTDALQLALACLCIVGAMAMYRLGRRTGASRAAARGGAAAWLFAPYVALDLYVRAAFAEAAAVAMVPAALYGLARALDEPEPWRVARGAALVALVPLAHNGVALLALPALAVFVLVQRGWRARIAGGVGLAMGLGLSAFFWLPALVERDFVHTERLREGLLHWSLHAISPVQLLWSSWGYGHSVAGPDDAMSFAIGPAHVLLAVLGLALVLRSRSGARRRESLAFAGAAIIGAWLATSWSAPVWSQLEVLQHLAYPWRTLLLPAIFLPLLAVPALEWFHPRVRLGAVVALVALNLAHTAPRRFLVFDDEYYAPDAIAARGINTTTREEYEPRWVSTRPPHTPERLSGQPSVSVQPVSVRSARQEFLVSAAAASVVEAATFFYPGWTVLVDGAETGIAPVSERGTISFRVPAGTHRVVLELRPTPLRRAASWLTLVSAAILLVAMFTRRVQRGRERQRLRAQPERNSSNRR
jgi:hypothetical protein